MPIGNPNLARLLRRTAAALLRTGLAAGGPTSANAQDARPAQKAARRTTRSGMSWEEQRKLLTWEDLEKVTGLKGLKPHEKKNERDQMAKIIAGRL